MGSERKNSPKQNREADALLFGPPALVLVRSLPVLRRREIRHASTCWSRQDGCRACEANLVEFEHGDQTGKVWRHYFPPRIGVFFLEAANLLRPDPAANALSAL